MLRIIMSILSVLLAIAGFVLTVWLIYKLWRWLEEKYDSGQGQWQSWQDVREREKRNSQLPEYMQNGITHLDTAMEQAELLPDQWKVEVLPLLARAEALVDLTSEKVKKGESIRTFFTVSLPALQTLLDTLSNDHLYIEEEESERVRQNITILEQDIERNYRRIAASRRFNFDVVMESIKQRIKYR